MSENPSYTDAVTPSSSSPSTSTSGSHSGSHSGPDFPEPGSGGVSSTDSAPALPAQSGPSAPASPTTDGSSTGDSTTDALKDSASSAKDEAASVAAEAKSSAQAVAETASEQAKDVATETLTQARDLLRQAREEATDQAASQQQRVAGGLRSLSKELSSMASGSETPGMATDLSQQASERLESVSTWLESREPGDVLAEATSFARRRPGAFLAAAAAVGFLGGRMTRSLMAGNDAAPKASGDQAAAASVLPAGDDAPTADRTTVASSFDAPPTAEIGDLARRHP